MLKFTSFCLVLLAVGTFVANGSPNVESFVGRAPFEDPNPQADGETEPQGSADPVPTYTPRQPKKVSEPPERQPKMRSLKPYPSEVKFDAVPNYDPAKFPSGPITFNHTEVFHRLPVSSQGRWLHSAVIIGQQPKLFIFGGIAAYSDKLYNDMWSFDYHTSAWFQLQRSYVPPFPMGEVKPKDVPQVPVFRGLPPDLIPKPKLPVVNPETAPTPGGVGFAAEAEGESFFIQMEAKTEAQARTLASAGVRSRLRQIYNEPQVSASTMYPPVRINNQVPTNGAPRGQFELPAQNREQVRQRSHFPRPLANYPGAHPSPFVDHNGNGVPEPSDSEQVRRFRQSYVPTDASVPAAPATHSAEAAFRATAQDQATALPLNNNPALLDWRSLIGLRPERDGLRDWPAMPTDLWSYDIDTKVWQCIQPMSANGEYPAPAPATRWLHSAVGISHRMIVFGGATVDRKIVGDVWIFNPADNTWTQAFASGETPLPRQGHCAVHTDTHMYIFGGISYGYQPFNDLWSYDVVANTWTKLADNKPMEIPSPRWLSSCTMVYDAGNRENNARMFVFGGVGQEYVPMNDLLVYTVESSSWAPAELAGGTAPFPRMMHNLVWMGSRLYVFGGMANNLAFEDLTYYDLEKKSWSEVLPTGSFPFARGGAAAAVLRPPPRVMPGRPSFQPFTTRPSVRWLPRYRKAWNDDRFLFVFGGVGATQTQDY